MAKTHKVTFRRRGVTIDCAEDEYILEKPKTLGSGFPTTAAAAPAPPVL